MRSIESMVEMDIRRYMKGFSLEISVKKVKNLRLGRMDKNIDRVAEKIRNEK